MSAMSIARGRCIICWFPAEPWRWAPNPSSVQNFVRGSACSQRSAAALRLHMIVAPMTRRKAETSALLRSQNQKR